SFNFTTTVLSLDSISGSLFGTGDMIRLWRFACTSAIYSSKVNVMRFALKFVEESSGEALTKTGGMESRNPPCGGMMLAHPVVRNWIFRIKRTERIYPSHLLMMIKCKHTRFHLS